MSAPLPAAQPGAPDISAETQFELYRMMLEARLFEEKARRLFFDGLVKGTSHLAIGQEAVAAGFAAAMQPGDLTFCTYRGHTHTLLRGADMAGLMADRSPDLRTGEHLRMGGCT